MTKAISANSDTNSTPAAREFPKVMIEPHIMTMTAITMRALVVSHITEVVMYLSMMLAPSNQLENS